MCHFKKDKNMKHLKIYEQFDNDDPWGEENYEKKLSPSEISDVVKDILNQLNLKCMTTWAIDFIGDDDFGRFLQTLGIRPKDYDVVINDEFNEEIILFFKNKSDMNDLLSNEIFESKILSKENCSFSENDTLFFPHTLTIKYN